MKGAKKEGSDQASSGKMINKPKLSISLGDDEEDDDERDDSDETDDQNE